MWRDRIKEAKQEREKCGEAEEHYEMTELAAEWCSCYVGELRKHGMNASVIRVKVDSGGEPIDGQLYTLGRNFSGAIDHEAYGRALTVADQMDARVEELKKGESNASEETTTSQS